MQLSFHGSAREVTGACFRLKTEHTSILVDCGLFQGGKEFEDMNLEPFPFDARGIDAVFVTHAHIDHIGRLPRLMRAGFSGVIYSTPPTKEMAALLLEDAKNLACRRENKGGEEQLCNAEEVDNVMRCWQTIPYLKNVSVGEMTMRLHNAGHILGSAFVEVVCEDKRIYFTGDLGNVPSVLLPPPDMIKDADYLVIESTYGNRMHESAEERVLKLERAVEDAASRRGVLMIPAFATERTQDLLYLLNEMSYFKRIPEIPVFVDSPLAIRMTRIFAEYVGHYRDEIKKIYQEHPNIFKFKKLRLTETIEESKKINDVPAPKVIISGSGMMNGGRILHHLRRYLPDPKSMLLVVGFQSAGSLGRRLIDGQKIVKMFGEDVAVEAEIRKINGFSAHADNPQLMSFVAAGRDTLKKVFVVHGEEGAALHLASQIRDHIGIPAVSPVLHEEVEI